MIATHELTLVDQPSTAEPMIILTMPAGAWQTVNALARQPRGEQSHRHLRRALASVSQMDTVLHAALLVRDGEVEGVSAHVQQDDAERALIAWLRQQPELWEGITIDDWEHLREAGLAPAELLESTTVMVPVDTGRGKTRGGHR